MIVGGVDPLDAIPAMADYTCPDCGDYLTYQGTQQSSVPLSLDGEDRGAGRYAIYACENHANYGVDEGEDPEDKCFESVTVYESGLVSVGGELEDRRETLETFLQENAEGDVTVEDVHDHLRI